MCLSLHLLKLHALLTQSQKRMKHAFQFSNTPSTMEFGCAFMLRHRIATATRGKGKTSPGMRDRTRERKLRALDATKERRTRENGGVGRLTARGVFLERDGLPVAPLPGLRRPGQRGERERQRQRGDQDREPPRSASRRSEPPRGVRRLVRGGGGSRSEEETTIVDGRFVEAPGGSHGRWAFFFFAVLQMMLSQLLEEPQKKKSRSPPPILPPPNLHLCPSFCEDENYHGKIDFYIVGQ